MFEDMNEMGNGFNMDDMKKMQGVLESLRKVNAIVESLERGEISKEDATAQIEKIRDDIKNGTIEQVNDPIETALENSQPIGGKLLFPLSDN